MVIGNTALELFIDLFRGRADCYGSWDGGCVRRPVTPELFRDHLAGTTQIGIYPAANRNGTTYVRWGCTDIDIDDIDQARRIQHAFHLKDITTWVEKTRKGYHVWLFATEPVEARTMRNAYLTVHKVADVPPIEVNPKQASLGATQVGNYVRLPYPNDGTGLRYMMHRDDSRMTIEDFLSDAHATRTTPEQIDTLAAMWKEPPPATALIDTKPSEQIAVLEHQMGRLARHVFRNGPNYGDRSTTLVRLAHMCIQDGMSPTDTFHVLYDADRRWGKFDSRPDKEEQLIKMVERAMSESGRQWDAGSQTNGPSPSR